jgi:lipoprotein-anchoring transpeptidase ErfK/SrfK
VFRLDKNVQFYLFVDLKKCTMDFYYLDLDLNQRVFLKRYLVAVGKEDPKSPSGSLTPVGKYTLGPKVAIYKPGVEHYFQNQKIQMIEVFGTRWLPFEEELENCSDSAKGYGIHGVPCKYNSETGVLEETGEGVGVRNSDGCLRLNKVDVEELFSIVITKPTIIEIAKDGSGHILPMASEVNLD